MTTNEADELRADLAAARRAILILWTEVQYLLHLTLANPTGEQIMFAQEEIRKAKGGD